MTTPIPTNYNTEGENVLSGTELHTTILPLYALIAGLVTEEGVIVGYSLCNSFLGADDYLVQARSDEFHTGQE